MSRELIIKLTKCTLVMDEGVLLRNLPPGILIDAIKKGKGYLRCKRVEQYEKSQTDWEKEDVYGKGS